MSNEQINAALERGASVIVCIDEGDAIRVVARNTGPRNVLEAIASLIDLAEIQLDDEALDKFLDRVRGLVQ